MRSGNLFVISGPAGTGKGTLIANMMKAMPDAWLSVSATTRSPRPGEQDGVQYYFVTAEEFDGLIAQDGLIEWATYVSNRYGTPRAKVEEQMAAGKQVILEIEVQGALQVKEKMPSAHLIFIAPPSLEELRRRLVGRGTETAEQVDARMETAQRELVLRERYEYCLVNDEIERATQELVDYINSVAGEEETA